MARGILWWGHFDPEYSRNRILREIFCRSGWRLYDFHPKFSYWGDIQFLFEKGPDVDLIWVPCFRQRDLAAAIRWGRRKNIPVVFDPLISAYDKQVFERKKFSADSLKAARLLRWERNLFSQPDLLIADTWEHARFFSETLKANLKRTAVVPVGAEEELFFPYTSETSSDQDPTVLFYGSFLNLQGPEIIVQAAQLYQGLPVKWKMIGGGPLLDKCRELATDLVNIEFLPWVPYQDLPSVIQQADILLGVFGSSAKAGRVIPNKVYQALACGKPLITRAAPAYPEFFEKDDNLGIRWVAPGDPQQLADNVAELVAGQDKLQTMGQQARNTYESHFSMQSISTSLMTALQPLLS